MNNTLYQELIYRMSYLDITLKPYLE